MTIAVSHGFARRTPNNISLAALCRAGLSLTALALLSLTAGEAQNPDSKQANTIRVFHLANAAQEREAGEIVTGLRNVIDPGDRIYLVDATNDIVVSAPPDQVTLIGRLIAEMDHPKQTYRLTYTLTETDAGKRVGVQHFAMVVVTGQHVLLKQGDKVPALTGSFEKEANAQQTQFTYIDVGMNFDATLDPFANGLRLRSKVEESSVAPAVSPSVVNDPVVRQTVLEGTSVIIPGKPLTLGSIDIAGSTRRVDIEVLAEAL